MIAPDSPREAFYAIWIEEYQDENCADFYYKSVLVNAERHQQNFVKKGEKNDIK